MEGDSRYSQCASVIRSQFTPSTFKRYLPFQLCSIVNLWLLCCFLQVADGSSPPCCLVRLCRGLWTLRCYGGRSQIYLQWLDFRGSYWVTEGLSGCLDLIRPSLTLANFPWSSWLRLIRTTWRLFLPSQANTSFFCFFFLITDFVILQFRLLSAFVGNCVGVQKRRLCNTHSIPPAFETFHILALIRQHIRRVHASGLTHACSGRLGQESGDLIRRLHGSFVSENVSVALFVSH